MKHLLSGLCGILTLIFIFFSIPAIWVHMLLTNTDRFVQTLSPLALQPDIQNFITQKATDSILQNAPLNDVAGLVLPANLPITTYAIEQLKSTLRPIIQNDVENIVRSPQFSSLFNQTLQSAHGQLLSQINTGSPAIVLDLRPTVTGIINLLRTTGLPIIKNSLLPAADSSKIIINGSRLIKLRTIYRYINDSVILIPILAIITASACIWMSHDRIKALRILLIGVGIIALTITIAIGAASHIFIFTNTVQQKLTTAVAQILLKNLQWSCVIICLISMALAAASKSLSTFLNKQLLHSKQT